MVVSTAFFNIFERVFTKTLYPYYYKICKEKVDEDARHFRTQKGCKNTFKFVYYIYGSTLVYMMLQDSYVFPPSLGGSGDIKLHLLNWPYIEYPPYYHFTFMSCMGFHMSLLINETFLQDPGKQTDFIEMFLHHLVTIYLIGFGYMS